MDLYSIFFVFQFFLLIFFSCVIFITIIFLRGHGALVFYRYRSRGVQHQNKLHVINRLLPFRLQGLEFVRKNMYIYDIPREKKENKRMQLLFTLITFYVQLIVTNR